jgi:hypothetical protein
MREDRGTRIGIDRGFFFWRLENGKKAHRNERDGLNPSFGRVEETGITIASFPTCRKFPFAIPAMLSVNDSTLEMQP